ncbi:MAG: PIN domain-containing protein [Campylobacterales bacterium]|nr:PIN domain-containing protein [Campylobacterales bacterium]
MKVFLDANIILDLIDIDRGNSVKTKEQLVQYITNSHELYTSCDIFTTVYYVASKKINFEILVVEMEKILTFIQIIPIDLDIINHSLKIAKEKEHKDLEDILQYLCAKSIKCELIVTNDKNFYSEDIKIENIAMLD